MVHLSDALRVLLVWRLGGLYLDMDYVVLSDMTSYQNITVTVTTQSKHQITNNAFSFSAGHPFLSLVMTGMERWYRPGCWSCIGPEIFTRSLKEYGNMQRSDLRIVDMKRS